LSLKFRLVLWVVLMLLLSLTLGAALAWWHATRSVATEMRAALTVGRQTVSTVIPHIGHDEDRNAEMRQLIDTFDGNRHLRATFVRPDGGRWFPLSGSRAAFARSAQHWRSRGQRI
jgi:two-component system sensor histidine kinase UhpB